MYIPNHFNDSTVEEVATFIKSYSFGILINRSQEKLWATHIPMELCTNESGQQVLMGHISKANQQWKGFEENEDVLAIFQGPHAYISSTWYNHKSVPTWNYIAVHVYGQIKMIAGDQLYNALKRLVDTYETQNQTYLKMEDLPEKMIAREMRGIVGFEILIQEVKAAFKLSQNKNNESHTNIVSALNLSEDQEKIAVAKYMKQRRKGI